MRFQTSDVFLLSPEDVRVGLSTEVEAEGTVVSFSDSGSDRGVFAVVEVLRRERVVVPVSKLRIVTPVRSED